MAAPKLPRSLDSLPEEVLAEIFSYLSVPDLLSCRLVNRHFDGIVGQHTHKILFNVDVGLGPEGRNLTTLAVLAETGFPFKNFRVHVEEVFCPGASVDKLLEIFSRASTLIVRGNLEAACPLAASLVKVALKSLKFLSFEGHCFYTFQQTFSVAPDEGPLSLPGLKELRVDFERASMPAAALEDALKAAPGLRTLSIFDSMGDEIPWLAEAYRRLSDMLFLSEAPVTAGGVIEMVNRWCPNLESLDLSGIHDRAGLVTLCDSEQLRSKLKKIVLGRARSVHPAVVRKILRAFADLEVFSVAEVNFGDFGLDTATSKSIVEFRLRQNTRVTMHGMYSVTQENPNMKILSLAFVKTDLDFLGWSSLRHLTTFEAEGMRQMSLEEWIRAIPQLGSQCGQSLVFLSLSDNYDVTNGVVRLVISNFPRLRTLKLGGCEDLTDDAFVGLDRPEGDQEWPRERDLLNKPHPALTDLPHLVHLDLECTKISDITLEFGLKHPSMEFLNIKGCQVSGRGLLKVAENAPNLRQLRVRLSDQITTDVVRDLVPRAKRLRRIEFPPAGCPLEDPEEDDETWCYKHLPAV